MSGRSQLLEKAELLGLGVALAFLAFRHAFAELQRAFRMLFSRVVVFRFLSRGHFRFKQSALCTA
jgi:energy-converting hydrogenase Eha subunit E